MSDPQSSGTHGLRLLLFANTSWYLWNFRRRLAQRLKNTGHEVIFAAPRDDYSSRLEAVARRVGFPMSRRGVNPLREAVTLWSILRLMSRVRPDVVLCWTPKSNIYTAIAGRLLRIPVIPNVSGLGTAFIREGLLARLVGKLYEHAFKSVPLLFFQNEEDHQKFIAAGWVGAAKAVMLPGSGVCLTRFAPAPLPTEGPFVFLYCGRLLADKGLRELVEATQRLRAAGQDFVLRLAGFRDEDSRGAISRRELDGWVAEGVVEFLGALDDVRPALAAAHCAVLPSYYCEGVPRSLLEAAATSRPVITTDTPGCRDAVLAEKSGLLCKPRNVESLAQCMERMLALTPAALAAMGRAGREYMEQRFSVEIVLNAYVAALADMSSRHTAHPRSPLQGA